MANKSTRLPGTEFESAGNRARSVTGGSPGSAGFNNTTATDIGAGALVALEAYQKINMERDAVTSVKVETEAVTSAEKAMAELDPMAADYLDKVKQISGDAAKSALETSGITTTAVRDDLERRMTRHAAGAELTAIKLRKDAVNKESLLTAKDAMNATSAKIRNDPANANAYLAEHQADMERLKVGMDPNTLRAFSRAAADDFAKNQVIGYAEKGNFGGARAAIKAQAEHLDTSVITGLSSYVDGKESKARADGDRARTANAATVLLDIEDQFNGRKEINPNTRENLDAMKARGAISAEQHLMAVKTWNNENQRYQIDAKKNATAAEQLATGTISSQENADRGFSTQFGNIPFGRIAIQGTPEQRALGIGLATSMAAGSGYLPTEMKNLIANADNITNPQQSGTVAYAAEAMDAIEAKAPGKIAGVTLSDTGVVNRVRSEAKRLMQDGIPKDEAYKQAAQTQMPKDKITIQGENDLREVATDKLKKLNPTNEALTAVTTFAERNIPFIATPEISAAMGQVWERTFKEAMVSTNGNEERAKALAAKKIQDTYGPTKVGVLDAKQPTALTHDGFPARQNSDGSYSTEVSITVTNPKLNGGKPTNIPSLWGGKEVSEDEAIGRAIKSGNKYQSFGSIEEAVKAAEDRSEKGGAGADTTPYSGYGSDVLGIYNPSGTTGMSGQGKVTIQAYPPEKYMNFPTLNADQKSKMIMHELDVINKKLGIAPNPSKDAGGAPVVQLVPDAQTADDVRKGVPPSYQYRVLRGDIYEPVPTQNGPLRYRVPSTTDQVKDNPVYMEAERNRLDADTKARAKDIELKKNVPDDAADERAKRMRDEGRRAKGSR